MLHVAKVFCLVNEDVGHKDMVSSSTTFSECSLKRVGNIDILHKLHEAGIEGASKELP